MGEIRHCRNIGMEAIRVLLIFAIVGLEALASNSLKQSLTPNLSEDVSPKIMKFGELTPLLSWGELLTKYREHRKDLPIINYNQTEIYPDIPEGRVEEPKVSKPLNITISWTNQKREEGFGWLSAAGCTNCSNCTNCTNSQNLTGCSDCRSCINCTSCKNCSGCTGCNGCENCVNCINCTNCKNESNCTGCSC